MSFPSSTKLATHHLPLLLLLLLLLQDVQLRGYSRDVCVHPSSRV